MNKRNALVKSVSTILGVSILAKTVAFLTEALLAAYLGTSQKADAYSMISGIQQVFYPMLSIGIWKVFLPEYKKQLITGGNKCADDLASKMLTIFTGASILMTIIMLCFADIVVTIVAPGFSGTIKDLCTQLVRISAPQYIFIIIAAFYASMLQSHGKFFASQIREAVSHIPVILSAIFLYKVCGVHALAVGLVFGSILRLFVQLPYLNWGYRFKFNIDFKDNNVLLMLRRMPTALITACVTQLNTLVDKMMASNLHTGAVSSLSYGQRLFNVLSGMITTAISTALYPSMAQLIAEKNMDRLKSMLIQTIYLISAIIVPVSIACIMSSKPIVSIVFQRGAFDSDSVQITAGVFSFYAIGMLFTGMKDVLSNVYYCYGDTKTTMKISIITIVLNIVLNFVFVNMVGIAGLALATSVSAVVGTCLLFVMLKQYINITIADIYSELVKVFIVAIVSCGIVFLGVSAIRIEHLILQMAIASLSGITIYLTGLKMTRAESFKSVLAFVKKINKNKGEYEEL